MNRLQKELRDFMTSPKPWCKVELADENNLFLWRAEVQGPDNTPYEKGTFKLEISIPTDYPFKPPKVKFLTQIYHPNVKSDGGFCTDILTSEGWSPQLRLAQVLDTIKQILEEPNPDNPLEPEIANEYKNDRSAFNKKAKEVTKKHAMK